CHSILSGPAVPLENAVHRGRILLVPFDPFGPEPTGRAASGSPDDTSLGIDSRRATVPAPLSSHLPFSTRVSRCRRLVETGRRFTRWPRTGRATPSGREPPRRPFHRLVPCSVVSCVSVSFRP